MTSRKELDAFYKVVDKLTANDKKVLCNTLRAVLKPKGEETEKGNLSTNSVLVDMLLQELEITSVGVKAGLSFWVSSQAHSNLEILTN
jgi:hypothetical protein